MHPSEKQQINSQLNKLIKHIEETIDVVKLKAQQEGMKPTEMMYASGELVIAPLLLAEAQALNAKVHLNIKEK